MATNEELETRLEALEARLAPVPLAANPPVTIGELTDVPAPGSPIASQWSQEVTNRIVHRFANVAARDAWTTRAPGSLCYVGLGKDLQMWDGVSWVPLLNKTLVHDQTYAAFESADITAAAYTNVRTFNVNVIASHLYQIYSALTIIFRSGAANSLGGLVRHTADAALVNSGVRLGVTSNNAFSADLLSLWRAPVTKLATINFDLTQAPWSSAPVRYTSGAIFPTTLSVIDLGPS